MKGIKSILRHIVDYPGSTTPEIAEATQLEADHVLDLLRPDVESGRVEIRKQAQWTGLLVDTFFASQSLIDEFDGKRQLIVPAASPTGVVQARSADGSLCFSVFADGRMSIEKTRQSIHLTPGEASHFVQFIGSLKVDHEAAEVQ
ncbi:TPA: hypothetical protein ACUNF5_004478 [Burkholderia orbicola]|nr:hypothetical protein DF039_34860 [Burkholderia cenocepacia]